MTVGTTASTSHTARHTARRLLLSHTHTSKRERTGGAAETSRTTRCGCCGCLELQACELGGA
eukprot:2392530-Rhodomonas_salina.1